MSWAPADSGVKGFEEERHFVFVCVYVCVCVCCSYADLIRNGVLIG